MIPIKLAVRNFMPYRRNVPPLHFGGIHKYISEDTAASGKRQPEEDAKEIKERTIGRILCYLFLVTVASVTLLLSTSVLAQEETIELEATYPRVESAAPGAIFKFPVSLIYRGGQVRDFSLQVSGPSGWDTYVTSSDESIRISVIKLEPNKHYPDQIKVIASPPPSVTLEAGDYRITLVASSATIRDSIELTAVVTPAYSLDLTRSSGFPYKVTAEKDNRFFITAENTGSGHLTSIRFSAKKPQGWIVEFEPDRIDRLAIGIQEEVEVNIKPASMTTTAPSYHKLTLIAEAEQVRKEMPMTVRVEEPKGFWMWIGGGIAVLVVVAFVFVFLRFGRSK